MRKFSIGLSLTEMSMKDWFLIIDEYHQNISYLYYSPPIEDFSSRDSLMDAYLNPKSFVKEYLILEYARSKGIKLELAINFENELDFDYLKEVLSISKNLIIPDSIVTYNHYLDTCIKIFGETPYYVLSYNHGFTSIDELNEIDSRFDCIVQGNRFLRLKEFTNRCNQLGFETKLLLNNGCSHNCSYCVTPQKFIDLDIELDCEDVLCNNIQKNGLEETIAKNTIFPHELELLPQHSDYKISNRPSSYEELKCMLDLYLFNLRVNDGSKHKLIYTALTRIYFYQHHYSESIDFEKIKEIKKGFYN
ncbi:MAG: hypothetical protein ACRCW9_06620 [Cetobacterium sp.]